VTTRTDLIAAALRSPEIRRPYVGHEMRGPMLMLTGVNSDLIWSATIAQIADVIDEALKEQELKEKDIPAAGTTSTPMVLSHGRPADHRRIAAELRDRLGEWGTVGVYRSLATARNVGTQIRVAGHNYRAYSPAGAFESRTELVPDGTRVEARYVGTPDTAVPAPDDAAWADGLTVLDEEER
jgi:hypothetical protein